MLERGEMYAFLRRQRLAVVSSMGPKGPPQSALVGIAVTPKLEIVFDTVRSSRKYRNLSERAECCLVLGWDGEQTVQMEGVAVQPSGAELEEYLETYFAAWPACRGHLAWPDAVHLVVRPRWLRFSDYDVTPPRIEEMWFEGPGLKP